MQFKWFINFFPIINTSLHHVMSMQSAHQNDSMLINLFRIKYLLLLIITLKYIVIKKKHSKKTILFYEKTIREAKNSHKDTPLLTPMH